MSDKLEPLAKIHLILPELQLGVHGGCESKNRFNGLLCASNRPAGGFAPLFEQSSKVAQFQLVLPFAGIPIPSVAGAIAIALSFQRMDRDCVVLFRNCAMVQAFPILCVIALSTIQTGSFNLVWAGYGVFFLFFGTLAFWTSLIAEAIPNDKLMR